MFFNETQSLNAKDSIIFILFGISIFINAAQLENEFFASTLKNVAYLDCLVSNPSLATQELTKDFLLYLIQILILRI